MQENVVLHEGCKTTLVHDVSMTILTSWRHFHVLTSFLTSWRHFHVNFRQTFPRQCIREERYRTFLIEKKCSYFSVKLMKPHIFKSKCNCRMKYARKRIHNGSSVQTENSITRVTARHHSASLVMPNNYPRDGIFNQHLTTIKYSYILTLITASWLHVVLHLAVTLRILSMFLYD